MNQLTSTTQCPCGNQAIRFHAGVPCCWRCYEIEKDLERQRDSRATKAMWERKRNAAHEKELAYDL